MTGTTTRNWNWRACLLILFVTLSCRSPRDLGGIEQLRLGMTMSEVSALLGDPTTRETMAKDGVKTDHWSYLVAHRLFRRSSTFQCLVFKDGALTEWVQDYGVGGHSAHVRQ